MGYRPYTLDQRLLLPPDLRDWLPKDHLAWFISDVVDALDLSTLMKVLAKTDRRGRDGYHPVMLVKLLIFAYCTGKPSSRRIERATYEDIAFRVLSGDQHPDHDTIADFRRRTLAELAALFVQVLGLCQKAGLVKLGHVALDGTKVKANASKHKAMSYSRMSETEKRLEDEVTKLLAEAEQTDAEEDARLGKGKHGDELPDELKRRETRLAKIREAKAALEQEAQQRAAKQAKVTEQKNQDKAGKPGKKFKVPDVETTKPEPTSQRNFTDPESRIMLDGATKSYVQAYNGQLVVDAAHQVIVAMDVTQQANDKQQLVSMLAEVKKNTGTLPEKLSADSGYFSESAVSDESASKVDLYVPPDRHKHGEEPPKAKGGGEDLSVADQMREKLRSPDGHAVYKMRKAIVEPVIGQTKERGFRHFSFRGLALVRDEWTLIGLSHNLLKLFRYGSKAAWATT